MTYLKLFLAAALMLPLAMLTQQEEIKTKIKIMEEEMLSPAQVSGQAAAGQTGEKTPLGASAGEDLADRIKQAGDLPVSSIEIRQSESSSGALAVFIPQNHRYPGTDIMDSRNDSAEVAQNQIYEIISFVDENYEFGFIMNEGDIHGEAQGDKKAEKVAEMIGWRNALSTQNEEFKGQCSGQELKGMDAEAVITRTDNELSRLDREIALAGAPYRLAAENADISLVGAEEPQTYAECSDLIRDYTYQKDQLAACQSGSGLAAGGAAAPDNERLRRLAALIDALHQADDSVAAASLSEILGEEAASGLIRLRQTAPDGPVAGESSGVCGTLAAEINRTYEKIEKSRQIDSSGNVVVPRREDNPYSGITDPAVLKEMIDQSEDGIQEKVINQRNEETAENFLKSLADKRAEAGIIQFGAGHEDGLVAELNKKGIDVVIVKPDEVSRRELADNRAPLSSLEAVKKLIKDN